ncbi:hypothetical protein XENOCAPTIV_001115 [Xenoophorus captivus]|uniref:Secreted protein n=1 Tax=Xenoophorus captivus TaxID=1517983 RepID=A0ABV0QFT0_9TELE
MTKATFMWIFFFPLPHIRTQNSDVCRVSMTYSSDECNLAVQTQVAFEKIRYISDLGPHIQVAWVAFEKIGSVSFRSVSFHLHEKFGYRSPMDKKKSDLGHFKLQCEHSLRGELRVHSKTAGATSLLTAVALTLSRC